MKFVAIDFETANAKAYSACSVGIVTIEDGKIIDEYYTLIRPPRNEYHWGNSKVHGITSKTTDNAPKFNKILPEILKRLEGNVIVAHNEAFDRRVLRESAKHYHLDVNTIDLDIPWQCTVKICRSQGHVKANLHACSEFYNISLDHHHALSDAKACALIYLYTRT
jgi:DNA polymerase-3 subunit epsilon